jgi:hypothetical protein
MDEPTQTQAPSEPDPVVERRAPPEEAVIPEPVFTPFSLTVGDGFKFGCGLMMAVAIAALIAILAFSIFWLAASIVGVAPPLGR